MQSSPHALIPVRRRRRDASQGLLILGLRLWYKHACFLNQTGGKVSAACGNSPARTCRFMCPSEIDVNERELIATYLRVFRVFRPGKSTETKPPLFFAEAAVIRRLCVSTAAVRGGLAPRNAPPSGWRKRHATSAQPFQNKRGAPGGGCASLDASTGNGFEAEL